jgi:nucleotide-binding universal stress UspA family protein
MKVLFATDGAEPSTRAGTMVAHLADRARTDIVVISVSDFEIAMREAGKHHHYSADAARDAAQQAADEAADALRGAGFERVEPRVEDGDEAITIVHAAETEGFGLVVVGSGKERWRDTFVLGSVSSSIVHAAPCPVLVVHRAPSGDGPIRVIVGTDGSGGATRSIEAFASFADPARCEVTVVVVADDDEELAKQHLEAAGGVLSTAGFRVETSIVPGKAATVLLEQVDQRKADLVVIGARGLGRFRAKVLGAVSDRMVRHAPATFVGR